MSTKPDISVIIPTYNLESLIGATLESVLLQQGVSMEILVVDDNSTDATVSIVQKYIQRYPHVRLLRNEKSKGVSGARNTAMEHMQGEACFFLDGDDLLPPNALAPLMAYMRQQNVPFVRGLRNYYCQQRWLYIEEEMPQGQGANTYPTEGFWQFLYDANFIKENGFTFPENCTRGEDRVFFCKIFCKHSHIPVINNPVYIYRINHKKRDLDVRHSFSFVEYITLIHQLLQTNQKMEFFPSFIQAEFCGIWLDYAYTAMSNSPEAIEKYLKSCSSVLAGKKELLKDILLPELQNESDAFWLACEQHDTQGMLAALQKNGTLQPPQPYMGISEQMLQKHWFFFRLLRRIKNICTEPQKMRDLYYIYQLEKKAKKNC